MPNSGQRRATLVLPTSRMPKWVILQVRALFAIDVVSTFLPVLLEGGELTHSIEWKVLGLGSLIVTASLLVVVEWQNRALHKVKSSMAQHTEGYTKALESYFTEWKLSPSEREVAVFIMKGFSNAEIAELRKTSEATIKTQLNAVYRKSGLASRQQLACFVFEDFIQPNSVVRQPIEEKPNIRLVS